MLVNIDVLTGISDRTFSPILDGREACQIQVMDVMPRMTPDQKADCAIPQMARISYGIGTKSVRADTGLIRYLKRKFHDSPFEAIEFKFRIRLPIFIYRQWFRHRTGDQIECEVITTDENARKFMSMNEYSARYSEVPDVWYMPTELRGQSKTNKQGGEQPLDPDDREVAWGFIDDATRASREGYEKLLGLGVSREISRGLLPVAYVTEFYWKVNLLNIFRWLQLRLDPHAQTEIRAFANVVGSAVREICPIAWKAFEDYNLYATTLSREECRMCAELLMHKETDNGHGGVSIQNGWDVLSESLVTLKTIPEPERAYHLSDREIEEFAEKIACRFVKPDLNVPLLEDVPVLERAA